MSHRFFRQSRRLAGICLLQVGAALFSLFWQIGAAQSAAPANPAGIDLRPAVTSPWASQAMMLGVTRAGKRIVAVGDHGVVLLSDDDGKSFRQARAVPRRATLAAVSFVDENEGWAVGHGGTILHSTDGGETWTVQREDYTVDQPLFGVWFKDKKVGIAGGLWSLLLRTEDGGKTWQKIKLPAASGAAHADYSLFCIFAGARGQLFMTAERGTVYRSDDAGQSWQPLLTMSPATLWTGLSLRGGVLLVAGVRGHILRSTDFGSTWKEVDTSSKGSITAMTQLTDGSVIAVGLDGSSLLSHDDGATFTATPRADRSTATAVIATHQGTPLVFTENGVEQP
ncbi:photosystem II stability/assembly factor-like uncharacterized protein [Paraburkholderia sp. BL18I3N2]|uniref:WD40/YVTN/BNR-like repeat-containing protein n=1 Tax=unclassified Paraburkholderia TaxID=2615204 RepID=UPI000D077765|nr:MULTISPECIES: YCF48-related protein [unclassified Paraburkholderia]PRX19204.1 photosystem II stability/assembly factor-like uncharacterized protein [Paraburkholderia sp. BL18I3N2]PRX89414.1 photosystem II stability/assembly factor-like uncharacterized protein [Paraburkholderia sp. BL25I1N1]